MKVNILLKLAVTAFIVISCDNKSKTKYKECVISEITSLSVDNIDSFQTFDQYVREVSNHTDADTLYVFKPYTNRDTIDSYLGCYNEIFDKISHDDQTYLLLVKQKDRVEYKYIKRGNNDLKKNIKFFDHKN